MHSLQKGIILEKEKIGTHIALVKAVTGAFLYVIVK